MKYRSVSSELWDQIVSELAALISLYDAGMKSSTIILEAKAVLKRAKAIDTGESNPICAWCDQEQGIIRPLGTSHDICQAHKEALESELDSHLAQSYKPNENSTH